MKNLLRASALLALVLLGTACPRIQQQRVALSLAVEEPTPTPTPYEDPADCKCYIIGGKRVCNSACPAR